MRLNQRTAGILLNYTSEAVKIITALVYTPVMLQLLGQSEYGLYQLVSSTVSYLSLLSLGFGSAYIRFYSRYAVKKDDAGIARLNGMFLLIFGVMAVLCLLCGSVMTANAAWIFGSGLTAEELVKAKKLMGVLVASMAITFPNSVFSSYVTAHEQFIFQKLLNLLQSILNPFLSLPLLLLGYGSVAVVAVSVLLTAAVFVSNLCFCFSKLKMRLSFRRLQFSLLKEMWVFTFFIFLNGIVNQVNWSVDKFLLGRMTGTAAVAIYGIGGQINHIYLTTSTAISNVFVPKVNRIVADSNDNRELTDLMIRIGRGQFMLLALVVSGFALFGRPFIALWAGPEYGDAYAVALLLIVPVTVPLIQNIGIEIQRAKNMHKARSIVYTVLAIMNVCFSIPLIRIWGCVGAALGTAISMVLGNGLFMNWYYHKKIGLDMGAFWKAILNVLPSVVVAGIFGVGYVSLVSVTNWGMLILSILLYTGVYVALVLTLGLNKHEKHVLSGMLYQIKRKKRA